MATPRGLVFVDKPAGVTSHDVVARLRRALGERRVGHAGTLDPFATGLVVCAVGHATRLLGWLDAEPKVYETVIAFGAATDTDDATGTVVEQGPPLDPTRLGAALASLTGTLAQVPPAFSAKHVDGTRAYALARAGTAVALPPVSVVVHRWDVLAHDAETLTARVTVGGGTYVRALARDLGRAVGTIAHCRALRRTRSGSADVTDAVPLADIARETPPALRDPRPHLRECATVVLDADAIAALRQGRRLAAAVPGTRAAFVDADGALLGVGERAAGGDTPHDDTWQPRVVFPAD